MFAAQTSSKPQWQKPLITAAAAAGIARVTEMQRQPAPILTAAAVAGLGQTNVDRECSPTEAAESVKDEGQGATPPGKGGGEQLGKEAATCRLDQEGGEQLGNEAATRGLDQKGGEQDQNKEAATHRPDAGQGGESPTTLLAAKDEVSLADTNSPTVTRTQSPAGTELPTEVPPQPEPADLVQGVLHALFEALSEITKPTGELSVAKLQNMLASIKGVQAEMQKRGAAEEKTTNDEKRLGALHVLDDALQASASATAMASATYELRETLIRKHTMVVEAQSPVA